MIDIETLKQNFEQFCKENSLKNDFLKIEEYYINNNFYTKNDNIWNEIMYDEDSNPIKWEENQENLEIDIEGWFHSDFPKCPDDFIITEDMFNILNEAGYITDKNENEWFNENFIFEGKTYSEVSDLFKEYIDDWWQDIDEDILRDNEWILESLSKEEFNESYSISAFIDIMAYWTIYFKPAIRDYDLAWNAGLYPFEYDGEFYVALGGCGMDLSPKLDAYQASVSNSIPSDSTVFSDLSYFDYVSPIKATEVFNLCKRNNILIKFNAEVKES